MNCKIIVLFILLIAFCPGCTSRPQKQIEWPLPNGNILVFHHEKVDFFDRGDHAKILEIKNPRGEIIASYRFAESHSGYNSPVLRIDDSNSIVWIVDARNHEIGASIDINSKKFIDEGGKHPDEVSPTSGRMITPLPHPKSFQ